MRFLILSSLYPPYAPGGAEITAWQHACWLRDQGHDVAVWTTAAAPTDQLMGVKKEGITLWRTWMPRPYPMQEFGRHPVGIRSLWHLRDHMDPRNIAISKIILDAFRPDMAVVHLLVGLGWNVLSELGRRDIPTLFALHDLVLCCVRSAMFRGDRQCVRRCIDCRLSSAWKLRMINRVPRLGFYSPSASNLNRLEQHVSLGSHLRRICSNPIAYPPPPVIDRPNHGPLRLLFVGRLHAQKGLRVLLEAVERLEPSSFTLDVAGTGPELEVIQQRFGHHKWLTFHGFVDQNRVAALMGRSHAICVPSIWNENAPGVIIQALAAGLPAIASDIGGIPELIGSEEAGILVPAGDVAAWEEALRQLIVDRDRLAAMSLRARSRARYFTPDHAGAILDQLMLEVAAGESASANETSTGR